MNRGKTNTLVSLSFGIGRLALPCPVPAQSLPVPLAVGDSSVLLKVQAHGVQIYICQVKPPDGKALQT